MQVIISTNSKYIKNI